MTRIVLSVFTPCVLALLVVGGAAGAGGPTSTITLYSAGDRVDDLPLRAILQRDDTAQFVSFVYGDCEANGDAGCAPPPELQVWPACRRNLGMYADSPSNGEPFERSLIRGVPAVSFGDGTRLELETGHSTVVVFAHTRALVLRIAAALRSLDDSVPPGRPLPDPAPNREEAGVAC